MFYEITSNDVQTELNPFQDVFANSSKEKISLSGILERWLLSLKGKPFEKPFFSIPNLPYIMQIDYSSSIYRFSEFENDTALSEEFFRKLEQIRALDGVSGILNNLSSEQVYSFEEAVKRRSLF
jgi:hypothetical protein